MTQLQADFSQALYSAFLDRLQETFSKTDGEAASLYAVVAEGVLEDVLRNHGLIT